MVRFLKLLLITGIFSSLLTAKPALAIRIDLLPTGDATVTQEHPTTNYGREDLTISAREKLKHTLIKFNAANGVPDGATINRAYLKLLTYATYCEDGSAMPLKVRRITSPWEEMTVTYQSSPDFSLSDSVTVNLATEAPSGYRTWDVTNIVKRWVEEGKPDYGFQAYYYNGSINCTTDIINREDGWGIAQLSIDYMPQIRNGDYVAPIISQVTVEHLSTVAVDVHWTTNEPATGQAKFGIGGNYDRSSSLDSTLRTSHISRIEGLTQGTTYNYRIIAVDAAGNQRILDGQTFTTGRDVSRPHATPSTSPSAASSTPPAASNNQAATPLHLQNIISDVTGPTSARIKWWSRPTGTSVVFISKTAATNAPIEDYDPPIGRNDDVETHEVTLQNLTPNTTYGFRVATKTTDNQWAVSDRNEFKTYASTSVPAGNSAQQPNGSNNNLPNSLPDQFETTTAPDAAEDSLSGNNNLNEQDEKEVQQQVSQWLNTNGSATTSNDKANLVLPSDAEDASAATTIIWFLMRLWFLIVIILAGIIAFFFWLVKRKEKKNKAVATTPLKDSKPTQSTEQIVSK